MLERLAVDGVDRYEGWPGYEWVRARAHVAVDPGDAANERIVDLDLAPTDEDGRVRFRADVRVLRPADGDRGNGKLLFVVANRGLLGGVPFSLGAPMQMATEQLHPGDGFVLEQGWTVAWCGWQWDVLRGTGVVGLDAPLADVAPGWMRIEWRPDVAEESHALSDSSALFTFADNPTVGDEGELTVRTAPDGERRTVPRDRWRFVGSTAVTLDGGFQPFHWYELHYRPALAPVVGTGLLAVRDAVSHLRADHDRVLAYGVSQSGRFLRQFLWDALNVDEAGRTVFDGVFSHVAGGRRGEFNHRYAQPSLTHVIGPGYAAPYDSTSLLARQRRLGGVPKTIFTNSAWEYWRGDGALLHVDPATGADLPEDADVRTYLFAGTDHLGTFPIKDAMPGANPTHHLDVGPLLRALFVHLDRWVADDVAPPPSAVPRHADGTAATRPEVLARFGHAATPDAAVLNVTRAIDPDQDPPWPLRLGEAMAAVVSAVDEDGNERAGIRLPEVAAPVGAFAGWNPRRPVDGLPDVLYEFLGSRLPFPPGRPTVADRYSDERAYEAAARAAAQQLVEDAFLLPRDVERTVAAAVEAYRRSG